MSWPDGKKRGSGPKHRWDLHTDCCKDCEIPRYGVIELPEQFYFCSRRKKQPSAETQPAEPT